MSSPCLAPLAEKLDIAEARMEQSASATRQAEALLNEIEHAFLQAVEEAKSRRELVNEALLLQNRMDAVTHCFRLLLWKALSHPELDQSIRYVVETNAHDAQLAKNLARCWEEPEWVFETEHMAKALRRMREASLLARPAGARGDVSQAAVVAPNKAEFVQGLLRELRSASGKAREEVVLALGEWGGAEEVLILGEHIRHAIASHDVPFVVDLISALANIGGSAAVNILFGLAENQSRPISDAAIAGLEYLSSGGSAALTEAPEPPSISTPELWEAYKDFAVRLAKLSKSHTAEEYIRFKAQQLLEIIRPALRTRPAA